MRPYPIMLALFALVPAALPAQAVPPSLDSIGAGCCTIRVRGTTGSAEGKFQGKAAADRVLLSPCKGSICPPAGGTQGSVVIPPGAKIEIYRGRSAGKGAIWGAVIGAVTLTAVWLGDQDLDMSSGGKIAAGIPIGALAGGGVGALIGALFPRWEPARP